MKKTFYSPLVRTRRIAISAATLLSVVALGAIPTVVPSVALAQAPHFFYEDQEEDDFEEAQDSAESLDGKESEETSAEQSEVKLEETTAETPEESAEQISEEIAGETLEESAEETSEEIAGETLDENAEETSEVITVETLEESAEETLEEITGEISEGSAEETSEGSDEAAIDGTPIPTAGGFGGFRFVDGFSGFRSAGGFQYNQPDNTCGQPKNYLWVGTAGGGRRTKTGPRQGYYGKGWIVKVEIPPSFEEGKIISAIETLDNRGRKLVFGDVAVIHDYSKVYGITLTSNANPRYQTTIYAYDEITGVREWARELTPFAVKSDGTEEAVNFNFNSLSVGPSGELLFSSYNTGDVYSVDPNDPNELDSLGRLIVYKVTQFPQTKDGTQLGSAGDFVVMPDKSLVGFGVHPKEPKRTRVVRWKNQAADGQEPVYSGSGTIIGVINKAVWGVGRVGSHIIAVPGDRSSGSSKELNFLDIDLSKGKEEDGENTTIPFAELPVGGFYRYAYGASSSGDTGQLDCEAKLRTRVVFEEQPGIPSGRARGEDDQAKIWSADSIGSTLAPKGLTTGTSSGEQAVDQQELVVPGSKQTVHQTLLRNGEANGIAPFYKTRLECVSATGKTLLEKEFGSSEEAIGAEVTIPELYDPNQDHFTRDISKDTTTCTFYNTPISRPSSLPMTGASANFWQLFAGMLVLIGFGAFPLLRRRKLA